MSSHDHAEPALIFLHLPKTAGVTLRTVVHRQFPRRVRYHLGGKRVRDAQQDFIDLPEAERANIMCFDGHMPFGFHQYFPQGARYISVLRDPVDRMVSKYYYAANENPYVTDEQRAEIRNQGVKERLHADTTGEAENFQTKMLAGVTDFARKATRADYDRAIANVDQYFAVVGLSERFDESLLLMKEELGWRNIRYIKRNVQGKRPGVSQLDPETREAIEQMNHLDVELYNEMARRFDERVAASGDAFARQLQRFQRANALNNKIYDRFGPQIRFAERRARRAYRVWLRFKEGWQK